MGLKSTIGGLTLAMGAVHAASNKQFAEQVAKPAEELLLVPVSGSVSNTGGVQTVGRNAIAPKKHLNLAWQTPSNDTAVSVAMSMQNTAVNLEDVDEITAVDCTGQASVAVTFANTEAFNEALTQWSGLNDSFVMITNHLGDCDTELERSFFVADSDTLASFESNLTIIAQAEKSDVVSTASSTTISFTGTATNPVDGASKRGISWNSDGLAYAYNYSIPKEQTIIDTTDLSVTIHEAYVNNSVRYSGHTKWEVLHGVTAFYLDIDQSLFHYADMDIKVKGPYTDSWTWSPAVLSYAVINIPGIISLGPSAGISFGGAVTAAVAADFSGEFTSSMPAGSTHIDFVDWKASYSHGWEADHKNNFNITEEVSVTIKPYIDFTVEFACKLFDGLIDLSTGVKAEPAFPFVTAATLTQDFHNDTKTTPNSTSTFSCANGLSEDISFQFSIVAFATQWLDITLYEYKKNIWTGCMDWFN